jgi:hypothetical protein
MDDPLVLQGRPLPPEDLRLIRRVIADHPAWHRTRLSRTLCELWDWRTPSGRLKDMACRSLLLKLEARSLLRLPPRQRPPVNAFRHRAIPAIPHATTPVGGPLSALAPLHVEPVGDPDAAALVRWLLARYHPRGYPGAVGESLLYLAGARDGRPLACLLFGAAAWRLAPRDAYIGWDAAARRAKLPWVANNLRFLILPWVQVPHLASHVLGRVARRIAADWSHRYGHPVLLLETFVEPRFRGTCYRAANWAYVGQTQGRSRNDRAHRRPVPPKAVYLAPLTPRFRELLRGG